jgi:hypothetical protein
MIRITIAGESRDFDDAGPSWISQTIEQRRSDRQHVCVQIDINIGDLNMRLSTPDCPRGAGGRPPNAHEREVLELWEKHGLNRPDFAPGNVIAFLKQFRRLAAA